MILASASPRRREMLERVGVAIEVLPAGVDETPHDGEVPEAYVARIAAAKAPAIAAKHPGRWVLAADTTVTIDGAILGKAETGEEAAAMLRQLAGRTHQVITGFAVAGERAILETVTSDAEVLAHVAQARERAGRAASEATIVAVSKTHPASAIREAAAAGAIDFGENYAQELAAKQAELGPGDGALRWR